MNIVVTVKTRARKPGVHTIDETHYCISVAAAPHEGAANEAVREALAEFFGVAQSRICLVKGARSKQKMFEIL